MSNNKKAFTLIELLVVVAIIGILAAVGVVAYNGYTASAKLNTTKTNYHNYHKFISSELTKCNNGLSDKAFGVNCPINTSDKLISALTNECNNGDLSKIMNPYLSNTKACRHHGSNGHASDLGYLSFDKSNATKIWLHTCWKSPCQPNKVNRDNVLIDVTSF